MAEGFAPSELTSDRGTTLPSPHFGLPLSTRIEWSQALPAATLAGVIAALLTIAALLMLAPLPVFGLGMLTGGSLSVVFYRRRIPVANLTAGMGARLGMASGILGGGIFAGLIAVDTVLSHAGDSIRQKLIEGMEQAAARNPDPQAPQALEFFKSPQGIVVLLTMVLIATLIAFVVCSGLGGALGAVLLRRKERP